MDGGHGASAPLPTLRIKTLHTRYYDSVFSRGWRDGYESFCPFRFVNTAPVYMKASGIVAEPRLRFRIVPGLFCFHFTGINAQQLYAILLVRKFMDMPKEK